MNPRVSRRDMNGVLVGYAPSNITTTIIVVIISDVTMFRTFGRASQNSESVRYSTSTRESTNINRDKSSTPLSRRLPNSVEGISKCLSSSTRPKLRTTNRRSGFRDWTRRRTESLSPIHLHVTTDVLQTLSVELNCVYESDRD